MRRRSLVFTAPRRVEAREEELGPPGPGEALVRTILSGISAGTELLFYRGEVPPDLPIDETLPALAGRVGYPLTYGYAAVGRVTELGPGVDAAWAGRLVFAFHPHASHFVAPTSALESMGCTPERAVFLPNMETAVNLLLDGQPLIGEVVVVFGQGVVGLLTAALLARLPLGGLVTVDPIPLRRQTAHELTERPSLDPTTPDLQGRLLSALGQPAPEPAADLVYELSGNPRALDRAIAATGYAGRLVIGSWYGQKRVELDLGGRFHRSKIRLLASQVSRIAPALSGRWTNQRRLQVAHDQLAVVAPERLITHEFPPERAAEAYALLDERPGEALQVIFRY